MPEYKLDTYEFDDLLWNDDDTCRATVRMFLANGIHEAYNVPIPVCILIGFSDYYRESFNVKICALLVTFILSSYVLSANHRQ